MTLKQPDPKLADPKYATTYQASRGGWFPKPAQPVPGTPQETGQ